MAIMYPKNIAEYMPTDSEKLVYYELKNKLPDSFDVFYSVHWHTFQKGKLCKSEADFIVASPDYGFLCLEVKGGNGIRIEDNIWYVNDKTYGERRLNQSPYDQAEKSMYHFIQVFSDKYNEKYPGIFGAGAIFPFYAIDSNLNLEHRHRCCTIDCNDLNRLYENIKKIFKIWGGQRYGRSRYSPSQHQAFLEMIREKVAISAAAGALVKYKEHQLEIINRVQDNFIYFLTNVRQFFIKGGAGTGKTWIAMKMAMAEAKKGNDTLFLCASIPLAQKIREYISPMVTTMSVDSLFPTLSDCFNNMEDTGYVGISQCLKKSFPQYDAVFIDEAQDFSEEWAMVVLKLLKDPENSRLGVFYDDVQIFREQSFKEGFGIAQKPYLLHENIRNTANIYNWTSNITNLGKDMIANPVEGPMPVTENVCAKGELTLRLELLFRRFLEEEHLSKSSLVIIVDDVDWFISEYVNGIALWNFSTDILNAENDIRVVSISDYKGLEADMVIYIHGRNTSANENYIAYTRAKFYLIELVREF